MSGPSTEPTSPSQPRLSAGEDLLLQAVIDPSRRPVTWQQLWTGDGLPESDQRLVQECKLLAVKRAVLGAALVGGLAGGIRQSHSHSTQPAPGRGMQQQQQPSSGPQTHTSVRR